MSALLRRIEKLEAANLPPPATHKIWFVRMIVGADGSALKAISDGFEIVRSHDEVEEVFRYRAMDKIREHFEGPCIELGPLDEAL